MSTSTVPVVSDENATAETVQKYPAIAAIIADLHAAMRAECVGAESDDVFHMRLALANTPDVPALAQHRAALQVSIDAAVGTAERDITRDILLTFRETFAPFMPRSEPASNSKRAYVKRDDSAVKIVARTESEITADPSIATIGAPLDAIDALDCDCRVVSVLRNGTTKVQNLKQQMSIVEENDENDEHDACLKLASETRKLFRHRAALRNE